MGKRLVWIGACALMGLLVAFAGMSSASAGQNTNNANGGNANSNSNRGRRGNSNANAGGMNANAGGAGGGNMNGMGSMGGGSMANANSGLASSDQKFVTEAAVGGMAEVEMGRLGVERATSDDVKMFSQRLIDDHTRANAELTQIAGTKGVMLPTGLDAKHQAVIDRLRGLSGAAFEREFAKVGVKDHRDDIKAFQKESNGGRDADIKGFATRTLPTLQDHLRMAQDAQTRLKGSGGGGNANGGGMGGNMNAGGGTNSNSGGNSNRGGRNRNSNRNSNANANGNSNTGGNSNNGSGR
jgi:putative membrane protein